MISCWGNFLFSFGKVYVCVYDRTRRRWLMTRGMTAMPLVLSARGRGWTNKPWRRSGRNDFGGKPGKCHMLCCKCTINIQCLIIFIVQWWYVKWCYVVGNGKRPFLYNVVSSPWDCSKRFTLHPLADLFIPTPSWLLWEAFSHAETFSHFAKTIDCRSSFSCKWVPARYSFTAEWTAATWGVKASKRQQEDFNPGSLVWGSNILSATLPHPT